jgi:hypothetical protein
MLQKALGVERQLKRIKRAFALKIIGLGANI